MLDQTDSPHCALTTSKTADQELVNGMNYIQKVFLLIYLFGIINVLYITCSSCGRPSRAGMAGLKNLRLACPKSHAIRFPWYAVFTFVLTFLIYFARPASLHCKEYMYIYNKSDSGETVYELPLLPNNTAVKQFYTNRSRAKCWLDLYHWAPGLSVTGRIRDNGQNFLQTFFPTGSSSSHSYFQIFFLISFLEEALLEIIIMG
jgi:hypothetical protein